MAKLEALLVAPVAIAIGAMALTMNAGISIGLFGITLIGMALLTIAAMFA